MVINGGPSEEPRARCLLRKGQRRNWLDAKKAILGASRAVFQEDSRAVSVPVSQSQRKSKQSSADYSRLHVSTVSEKRSAW